MASNFPTGLDSLVNPTAGDKEDVVSHSAQHSNANDGIEAVQSTVGITNSTVPTSHDYRIKQVENKTVDASATVKGITKLSTTPVSASNPIALGENDTRVLTLAEKGYIPTSGQKDALAGTSGTPSSTNKYITNADTATSGADKVLRLDGNGKLPVLSGENLTNILFVNVNKIYTSTTEATNGPSTAVTIYNATLPANTINSSKILFGRVRLAVLSSVSGGSVVNFKIGATTVFSVLVGENSNISCDSTLEYTIEYKSNTLVKYSLNRILSNNNPTDDALLQGSISYMRNNNKTVPSLSSSQSFTIEIPISSTGTATHLASFLEIK